MGNYYWTCSDCGKITSESTTADYDIGDEVECPWCGRIAIVSDLEIELTIRATTKKVSPTKAEELEKIKMEYKSKTL